MPLTWFAHQVPVVGMRLARDRWFDTVALCVGSMMPDLMYSFSDSIGIDSHAWPVTFTYGIPLTVVIAVLFRRVVAPIVPMVVPDVGPFRLRSYGVLAQRRPGPIATITSSILGIGSHVSIDWFTHTGRPGPRWLGYEDTVVTINGYTQSLAEILQLVGHVAGSLAGLWLLWLIGDRRYLERWYGEARVQAARSAQPRRDSQIQFWAMTAIGGAIGLTLSIGAKEIVQIQRLAVGALLGSIVGAMVVRSRRASVVHT